MPKTWNQGNLELNFNNPNTQHKKIMKKEISDTTILSAYKAIDFPQMHFEFKDWNDAFDKWSENHNIYGDNIQFVVCHHAYTSGYWIEKAGTELGNGSRVYTHKQVISLKSRVKKEILRAAELGVSPRFTH